MIYNGIKIKTDFVCLKLEHNRKIKELFKV